MDVLDLSLSHYAHKYSYPSVALSLNQAYILILKDIWSIHNCNNKHQDNSMN